MHYTDFHTHLDQYKNLSELYTQLSEFEGTIVTASTDVSSYDKNLRLRDIAEEKKWPCTIIPSFGIHPMSVLNAPSNLHVYDSLCKQSPVIGEIGMDLCWYKDASSLQQEKVFRYFLERSNDEKKYCVIHTKDAEEKIARILEDYPEAKPVIHWYDGPEEIFDEFVHRNYFQTFGCQTIRSKKIQNFLCRMPAEKILAETDNPESEPWLGGTDNSILLIKRIYSDIAKILNMQEESCTNLLNKNADKIISEAAAHFL